MLNLGAALPWAAGNLVSRSLARHGEVNALAFVVWAACGRLVFGERPSAAQLAGWALLIAGLALPFAVAARATVRTPGSRRSSRANL